MPPADNGPRRDGAAARAKARRVAADQARGALVLIGGACTPEGAALGTFLHLSGADRGSPIVGFTTASGNPERAARHWRRDFADAGAPNIEIPIVSTREQANDPEIAALVCQASGIFLGGGDQVRLIATLSGTAVAEAIRESYMQGAIVCGTSAGAAALTETTMAGGEIDESGNEVEIYIGPGLGLLTFETIIDTHFAQRRRLHRLFVTIAGYPQLLGLGIDEDTAFVVQGHVGEVAGSGGVTFVDGRNTVRYDNASRVTKGGELTLSHLRVGLVGTGHKFDLRARELEVLVNGLQDTPAPSSAPSPIAPGQHRDQSK